MDHQFKSKQYQQMVVIKIYVQRLGFHDTSMLVYSLSLKCVMQAHVIIMRFILKYSYV